MAMAKKQLWRYVASGLVSSVAAQFLDGCNILTDMSMFTDSGGGVPLLHLYGKAGRRTLVSSLLKVVLLRVCTKMANGATITMPALPRRLASSRAGELPLGGRGHSAD